MHARALIPSMTWFGATCQTANDIWQVFLENEREFSTYNLRSLTMSLCAKSGECEAECHSCLEARSFHFLHMTLRYECNTHLTYPTARLSRVYL